MSTSSSSDDESEAPEGRGLAGAVPDLEPAEAAPAGRGDGEGASAGRADGSSMVSGAEDQAQPEDPQDVAATPAQPPAPSPGASGGPATTAAKFVNLSKTGALVDEAFKPIDNKSDDERSLASLPPPYVAPDYGKLSKVIDAINKLDVDEATKGDLVSAAFARYSDVKPSVAPSPSLASGRSSACRTPTSLPPSPEEPSRKTKMFFKTPCLTKPDLEAIECPPAPGGGPAPGARARAQTPSQR